MGNACYITKSNRLQRVKKRARGVEFLGGIQCHSKRGTNSNNYFPMGHIHRITTGHQGHKKKKGDLFLALQCKRTNIWRASRPFLRASEAMALDGLGLIGGLF